MTDLVLPARNLVPLIGIPSEDILVSLIYHPVTGLVYRQRFRMALKALAADGPLRNVLEVGCGAGLLLTSLSRLAGRVEAVDVHHRIPQVEQMVRALALDNVKVRFGSIFALPYPDGAFDGVVCISVLEHFRDLDAAVSELARVTARGRPIVLGFPTKNLITRALFRIVGYDDNVIHPSSHRDILNAVSRYARIERVKLVPPGLPLDLSLYVGVKATA